MDWLEIKSNPPPEGQWISIMLDEEYRPIGTGMVIDGNWVFNEDYRCWGKPSHWRPLES